MLRTYKTVLEGRTHNLSDEQLCLVLTSTTKLLRRHSRDNRLCCDDDDAALEVTKVDKYGFVKEVACRKCRRIMTTKCHRAKKTQERIYETSTLKPGDHICWHRPYVLWHHAIVSEVDGNGIQVIHYNKQGVVESPLSEVCLRCRKCDVLYRVNYQDCYTSDYTVLRARKLLGENRYNGLQRNCEHFSHWCKTGSNSSSQINLILTFFGKMLAMLGVRAIALIILLLILEANDHPQLDAMEKWLTGIYISVISTAFVIYVLYSSISSLHPAQRLRRIGNANDSELEYDCTRNGCSPCCRPTCWNRPSNLVCGLFCRTVLREIPVFVLTLCIVLFDRGVKTWLGIKGFSDRSKVAVLVAFIAAVQLVGYALGMFFGRWIESIFECGHNHTPPNQPPFHNDEDNAGNVNNIQDSADENNDN